MSKQLKRYNSYLERDKTLDKLHDDYVGAWKYKKNVEGRPTAGDYEHELAEKTFIKAENSYNTTGRSILRKNRNESRQDFGGFCKNSPKIKMSLKIPNRKIKMSFGK